MLGIRILPGGDRADDGGLEATLPRGVPHQRDRRAPGRHAERGEVVDGVQVEHLDRERDGGGHYGT